MPAISWKDYSGQDRTVRIGLITGAVFGILTLLFGFFFGVMTISKGFGRYQARKDAANRVAVSSVEIRNQEQRVQIARQQAQIRFENAKGVRAAQDEIAKTLTPLYVQFEMVDALKQIAQSGSNSSVVFIPDGANGIPLVADAQNGKVGLPNK